MIEEANKIKKINPYLIAITVVLPTFFAMLGTSATNVAMPNIAGFVGATQYESNPVLTSYMICNAIVLPISGWLTRQFGRKTMLYACILSFTIGAVLCMMATSLPALEFARAFQGLGGGALTPLCQSTLLDAFPEEERGKAMGLFGMSAVLPPLVGPTLGGYLTDNFSWEFIFIINIPVGILSLLLIKLFIIDTPVVKDKYSKKVDVVGLTSCVLWLASMQYVLDKGQQFNWFDTTWICWLSGFSVFAFIFFVVWELEYKFPIVDVRVFKDLNFAIGSIIGSFVNMILFSTLLLIPMLLQSILGYSAFTSGLALLPRIVSCFFMLLIVGKISDKIDNRILIALGLMTLGGSTFMFTMMTPQLSLPSIMMPNFLLGAGIALTFIPISSVAFGTLPKNKIHDGAGLHSLSKCVATAFITSLSSSMVIRLSQVHQGYLVKNMSMYNPVFQQRLMQLKMHYMTKLPAILATKRASGYMYKEMLRQSKMFSFIDIFQVFALAAFLLIPLLLFIKVKRKYNSSNRKNSIQSVRKTAIGV